jgi:hypothetical protein
VRGCISGGTQKVLRRCLRKVFGRNRKSRRAEAAGRRNSPEAVPNEKGGTETMYELRRTLFWETESTIHTGRSPSSRSACWWTKDEQSTGHHIVGMALREATNGRGESYVEDRCESERRGKGKHTARGGNQAFQFRLGSWTFPLCRHRPRLARAARASNPESNLQPRGFLDAGDFAKCGRVRRTGPSGEGRPRSVLRLR